MTAEIISRTELTTPQRSWPFFLAYSLVPLVWIAALFGGWWVLLVPIVTWHAYSVLDLAVGLETSNADLDATSADLSTYRKVTLFWAPIQFLTLFSLIAYVPNAEHLNSFERVMVFFGAGVMTGTVGINFSHELMHQTNKLERWMADILLAMVLYSHFRSEHLLVHHRYVGTPRDPVTAQYNEGFHRFYPRVLKECLLSAFRAEREKLARKNLPWSDRTNPFWRYWALQAGFLLLALSLGGWSGFALFLVQAGTTRKHLGDGKYEHVRPHHSWNAAHKVSNWLLINLQRHSDHHYKPDRRFPLLQNYTEAEAPQLPFSYSLMTILATMPPLWRKVMNPRVKQWRAKYYPEISDWRPYDEATNPQPR